MNNMSYIIFKHINLMKKAVWNFIKKYKKTSVVMLIFGLFLCIKLLEPQFEHIAYNNQNQWWLLSEREEEILKAKQQDESKKSPQEDEEIVVNRESNTTTQCVAVDDTSVYIYMYHYIRDRDWDDPNASFIQNAVITENFDAQLEAFEQLQSEEKIKIIFLSELENFQASNCFPHKNIVVLTADDGWDDNYINLFPIVIKHNLKFHLSIISDYTQQERYDNFITLWELTEITDSPNFEIIGHTFRHLDLRDLSDYYLEREVCQSKKDLEAFIGKSINTLVYPAGKYNVSVMDKAKECWYSYALTTKGGVNNVWDLAETPFELKRIRVSRSSSIDSLMKYFVD